MDRRVGGARIELRQGDITREAAEGIVNAANPGLRGGGGVDGAIHRAAGPSLLEECRRIREERGGCPPGTAVATGAGRLPARHVIHTVGPVWRGGGMGEEETLASCYRESLALAETLGLRSVSFPSIATGVYGYPAARAATVALSAVAGFLSGRSGGIAVVRFVLFDRETYDAYANALAALIPDDPPR